MPVQYGLGDNKPANTNLRWLYLPFMFLLALVSMTPATQRIAAFWSYQPALGDPWFFAGRRSSCTGCGKSVARAAAIRAARIFLSAKPYGTATIRASVILTEIRKGNLL